MDMNVIHVRLSICVHRGVSALTWVRIIHLKTERGEDMVKKNNPIGVYLKEEFEFNPDFSNVNKKSTKGDKKNGKEKKKNKTNGKDLS